MQLSPCLLVSLSSERCTLQLWSFEKESENFGGKGILSPPVSWLDCWTRRRVVENLPFVNDQEYLEEKLFLQTFEMYNFV
ncbi:hypothetical protein EPR50_G00071050 [Perca flavescens]|uniref:Uncharacterized protein n=1 Tax=Perca flavescens TaxID=8167 RepID=A0A484DAZ2_PERFV|nr:hypothetical protein EPR50_G00071050 [Perca flavescens]